MFLITNGAGVGWFYESAIKQKEFTPGKNGPSGNGVQLAMYTVMRTWSTMLSTNRSLSTRGQIGVGFGDSIDADKG